MSLMKSLKSSMIAMPLTIQVFTKDIYLRINNK